MHSKVFDCFILIEGELEYFISDELTGEKTTLFNTSKTDIVIGWEVLHVPERFIASVAIKSVTALLVKVSKQDYLSRLNTDGLKKVSLQINSFLEVSFLKQASLLSKKVKQRAIKLENYFISNESTPEERARLLKSSPFFGEFPESEIKQLVDVMVRREYEANELIYDQDEDTSGIFILIQGEVSMRRLEDDTYLDLRSISTPGYLFGWSSTFDARDICRAYTEQKTSVYFISKYDLSMLTNETPFGMAFFKMIIWLMSNQLQLSHSRYLYLLEDHNLVSVKHLIDMNRPRIPLSSPLHQVPHLLKDHTTQAQAFETLHRLHHHGTNQERHLSSICLDLLKSEERETLFLSEIGNLYNRVVQGKPQNEEE
ncbi:MAG: Crp/Fnr family transcriptional regulator, partial [Bacteroidota bacterium]